MRKKPQELHDRIKNIVGKNEVNRNFLTRWKFENCLDLITVEIHDCFKKHIEDKKKCEIQNFGCTILYLGDEKNYYVGGASSNRLKMHPSSRFYECPGLNKRSYDSFTMCSASKYLTFVLDNFSKDQNKFKKIKHVAKASELGEKKTQSYYCIPSFSNPSKKPKIIKRPKDLLKHTAKSNKYPKGILRLSFSNKDLASEIDNFLKTDLLITLFKFINKGQKIVTRKDSNKALAIADFLADLLQHKSSEFSALKQLTFHLQTLFGNCECSVFLANKQQFNNGIDVDLYLAATTCQSDIDQHIIFRKTFFDEMEGYTCRFKSNGDVKMKHMKKCGKTEFAYYQKNIPYLREENTRSSDYHGKGEFTSCSAFLAVPIPSPEDSTEIIKQLPYGVIRIVRKTKGSLDETDKNLAMAIARAITYWVDFFPKNENLKIAWDTPELKESVENILFDIRIFSNNKKHLIRKANLELRWLLQKIFFNSHEIKIKRLFSGRSGAVILLVENDNGLDLILKCSKKNNESIKNKDIILTEIDNYEKYIQGKLELNHNIIYKELIRETQSLVGFATSFLGSKNRNRMSMTDFFLNHKKHKNDLYHTFAKIADRLINDVWGWWYESERMEIKNNSVSEYINILITEDSFFSFFEDMDSFDSKVFHPIQDTLPFDTPPSHIWKIFVDWMVQCKNCENVKWQRTATHGDTHGDNIFFDPDTMDMWLIDFARTNKRTCIFDLAMLECDIKFRHIPNIIGNEKLIKSEGFITDIWKFESDLFSQETYGNLIIPRTGKSSELKIASKAITDLRQIAAHRLDRKGSFNDYKFVLFILAFKYMKVIESDTNKILPYISALAMINSMIVNKCEKCTKEEDFCFLPNGEEFQIFLKNFDATRNSYSERL